MRMLVRSKIDHGIPYWRLLLSARDFTREMRMNNIERSAVCASVSE